MRMRTLALTATLASVIAAASACGQPTDQAANDTTAPAADATAAAAPAPTDTADASGWTHPMTPWGEPDLRGTWPLQHLTGTPLQRDPQYGERRFLTDEEMAARDGIFAGRDAAYEAEAEGNKLGMGHWVEFGQNNALTSLIVDPPNGRLPALTEEGERRRAEMRSGWMTNIDFDWVTDFDNWDRCITRHLPASMLPSYYNNGVQIIQSPGVVVIRLEMIHEARIIYTDGRPQADSGYQTWFGDSRGRWEGNTLVVETTNFNDQGSITNIHTIASPPFNNTPHTTDYKLVETFTRTGDDTLTYTATVNDPEIWTAPWTVELPWLRDNSYELYEYACHEANVMIPNYISSSRAERGVDVGDVAASIRARQAGGTE